MIEALRPLLYYPLGLLPSVFFTLRILIQWYQSEKRKKSYTGKTFWKLSLAGNLLLLLHYIIQVQYPFAMIQVGNAVISWRNLDLLKKNGSYTTRQAISVFLVCFALVTVIFIVQSYMTIGEFDWIRTPTKLFDENRQYHQPLWHLFGALGGILFASRFWIQWWNAERYQKSELGKSFWWTSIIGSIISLIYFIKIGDTVSMINYGFGLVPYIRNLVLIRNNVKASFVPVSHPTKNISDVAETLSKQ